MEQSVLILHEDGFEKDEDIRKQLADKKFKIVKQTFITLSKEQATTYMEMVREDCTEELEEKKSKKEVKQEDVEVDYKEPESWIIDAMSCGPLVVLLLEKENAVMELKKLVGPANAQAWQTAEFSNSLRGQFGINERRLSLRSSIQSNIVQNEIEFFFNGGQRRAEENVAGKSSKSEKISLNTLLKFLFPPKMQHPKSTGRLYVFALYGPLDSQSRLRSGNQGMHVVSNLELDAMCWAVNREDVLSVYTDKALTAEEEEEIVKQADHVLKIIPQHTKEDIQRLMKPLPHDSNGMLSFHDMQRVIMQERQSRVKQMKAKAPIVACDELKNKLLKHGKRIKGKPYQIAPKSMFIKGEGLDDSENAVLTTKLLSTAAFQICAPESSNSPEITQNVKLLRHEYVDEKSRPAWSHSTKLN